MDYCAGLIGEDDLYVVRGEVGLVRTFLQPLAASGHNLWRDKLFQKPRLRPLGGPDFYIHNMGSILLGLGISLFLVVEALSHPPAMADQAAVIPTFEENQLEGAISAVEFLEETLQQKGKEREAREEKGASPVRFQHTTLKARVEPGLGSIDREATTGPPATRATRLVIPALGLDVPIVELPIAGNSRDVSGIADEVAHLGGTANLGEKNNMVLAGHVTLTRGVGPFIHLEDLEVGDQVIVYAEEKAYSYSVVSKEPVAPTDVYVAHPTSDATLTLLTCTNWDPERRGYLERLVVVAKPVKLELGND